MVGMENSSKIWPLPARHGVDRLEIHQLMDECIVQEYWSIRMNISTNRQENSNVAAFLMLGIFGMHQGSPIQSAIHQAASSEAAMLGGEMAIEASLGSQPPNSLGI